MSETVTLTDELPELIQSAVDEVEILLGEYWEDNHEETFPCLNNNLDYDGRVHEIVDGAVPIYTHELDALEYFHGRDGRERLDEEFGPTKEEAGKEGWPMGKFPAAVYQLIMDGVNKWYQDDAEDIWDGWNEHIQSKAIRKRVRAHYYNKENDEKGDESPI